MKIPFLSLLLLLGFTACGQEDFSVGFDAVFCGDTRIIFDTRCATPLPGVQFIHVHENEKTAVEAANKMLDKYSKGCFATWKAQDDRYVRFTTGGDSCKFDPNRIYSAAGRAATLKANGSFSVAADSLVANVARTFASKYVDSFTLVVALHNNTNGGGLTIKSYQKGGEYARDAKKVNVNKARDEDDFFLTTDERIYHYLRKKGFNILLQDNANVTDDGSLSVYAAGKKIPYLNVEAQHGHLKEQLDMLDAVQEMIKANVLM